MYSIVGVKINYREMKENELRARQGQRGKPVKFCLFHSTHISNQNTNRLVKLHSFTNTKVTCLNFRQVKVAIFNNYKVNVHKIEMISGNRNKRKVKRDKLSKVQFILSENHPTYI